MGGMNALGGPGVWSTNATAGVPNLGVLGPQVPVQPGPEAAAALGVFGQQVPQHLWQTQLFHGLEGQHPRLAQMLEGGIEGAAHTPGPVPGMPEGAGGGISRALQGGLGAEQAHRQYQIAQLMAPYQLAKQTAELRGAAQEEDARKAQIGEMSQRAEYFKSMAGLTAPQAHEKVGQLGLQIADDKLKEMQAHFAEQGAMYESRSQLMAKHYQEQFQLGQQLNDLKLQMLQKQNTKAALAKFGKLQNFWQKSMADEEKQYSDLEKQYKDSANSIGVLTGDKDAMSAHQKLQQKLEESYANVEHARQQAEQFNNFAQSGSAMGIPMDEIITMYGNNPTNPMGRPGGELQNTPPAGSTILKWNPATNKLE